MNRSRLIAARAANVVVMIGATFTFFVFGSVAPAGALAPQPIDASTQGPFAFVAMTVMIVIFVFTLFYMDRIRSRRDQ